MAELRQIQPRACAKGNRAIEPCEPTSPSTPCPPETLPADCSISLVHLHNGLKKLGLVSDELERS